MQILNLLKCRRAATSSAVVAAIILLFASLLSPAQSFFLPPITTSSHPSPLLLQMAKSYGPQDAEIISSSSNNNNSNNIKEQFASLLNKVATSDKPEELPSLLASNIEMILMAMNTQGLIEQVIQDDIQQHQQQQGNDSGDNNNNDAQDRLENLSTAVNVILSFVETFVQEAQSMEDVYKKLMGKIFATITPSSNQQVGSGATSESPATETTSATSGTSEAALEELLSNNQEAFTPGFLRHIEGECNRIASLPTISPESAKMLEILHVIQTRILEELGKTIGEGAIVLGQLLGYENKAERLAVLDAGLAVRGVEFARELKGLTCEALEGFEAVQQQQQDDGGGGGVDPELVKSVEEMDERIQLFIDKSEQHFQ